MFFLSDMLNRKITLPRPGEALPGRTSPVETASLHAVLETPLAGPYPDDCESVIFGMGRFWEAERLFWREDGVHVTAAGYAGGFTPNPTHQEVMTGLTGHAQVVRVVFEPAAVPFQRLLKIFWEGHDPTQGMRQGSDIGTAYRSVLFTTTQEQAQAALASRDAYQKALAAAGVGTITTAVEAAPDFYFAEAEHQQYLARNRPAGASPKGTGIAYG